jgi:serine/threonine protein kinase
MGTKKKGYDSLVGQTPDGYVVLKELGTGAGTSVYQAMEAQADNRLLALKILDATEQRLLCSDDPDRNPFDREAEIASSFQDHGIIRTFGTGRLPDGRYYLAMEYVDGMPLNEEIGYRGTIPWQEAVERAHQVAQAVTLLHEAQIIHRDLKPGNLMVRPGSDGQVRVKLIDFGSARRFKEEDEVPVGQPVTPIGSPQYMAPEQARGDGSTYRTDVYALGAVLYEMIAGQPVISATGPTWESYRDYLCSDSAIPSKAIGQCAPGVPDAICDFVQRSVSRDVRLRPFHAGEFAHQLEQAMEWAQASTSEGSGFLQRMRRAWTHLRTKKPG